MNRLRRALLFILVLLTSSAGVCREDLRAQAQIPPPTLAEALYRLPVYLRILHTGAHPDDENNPLLVYLSRQVFARTAYLSATRGDGGQNLIGDEMGEALGVLRTEELLAAQKIEAVDQYFTRAYDFGFTRSAEETLAKWGHEEILADFVRDIRRFRPDIIISRFSGAPSDGHGQHQAAGILTKEAFRAAGDPKRFPEQIAEGFRPWQARKLYLNRGRGDAAPGVSIDLGMKSPLLGRSYVELGIEARNFHRSQFQALGMRQGPFVTSFQLIDAAPKIPDGTVERDLADGFNTSLTRIAEYEAGPSVTQLKTELAAIENEARKAIAAYESNDLKGILPSLRTARRRLWLLNSSIRSAPNGGKLVRPEAVFAWKEKLADFDFALEQALGIELAVQTASPTVSAGETAKLSVYCLNGGELPVTVSYCYGCTPLADANPKYGRPGATIMQGLGKVLPGKAELIPVPPLRITGAEPITQPYWLELPRIGDRFQVRPPEIIGVPKAEGPFRLFIQVSLSELAGDGFEVWRQATVAPAESSSQRAKEIVKVVPKLSLEISPPILVAMPDADRQRRVVYVSLSNQTVDPLQGALELALPKGWRCSPPTIPFSLKSHEHSGPATFEVEIPARAKPAGYSIRAEAKVGTTHFDQTMTLISYPHVNSNYLYRPAEARVEVFDVKVAPDLKAGYISAHGDLMPASLRALDVSVTEIDAAMLATGDLSRFDTILIGPRAYEGRADLVKNNDRLLEYARNGGTLIVQYQVASLNDKGLTPFPLRIANDERVTDERAPVRLLDPNHPIFHFPNQISPADFEGWVQERGLYFATSWDENSYKPLMESHDAGEKERSGGMLIADYGKGRYIYTAYAWFRQLPAGVPGAFRLFSNMLSLPKYRAGR